MNRQAQGTTSGARTVLDRQGFVAALCAVTLAVTGALGAEVDVLANSGPDNVDGNVRTLQVADVEIVASNEVTSTVQNWLRFRELAGRWRVERGSSSSLTWMTSRPSYLRIIAMAEVAVPFLLQELRYEPDHWFTALRAITGENPVPEDARGNLRRMAAAWIQWGSENNYLID